jgi:hypothetical protein
VAVNFIYSCCAPPGLYIGLNLSWLLNEHSKMGAYCKMKDAAIDTYFEKPEFAEC